MLVVDGIITSTGKSLPYLDSSYKKVNLNGAIIFAPFTDAHVHFLATGLSKLGCQLDDVETIGGLIRAVRKESKKREIVIGWKLQESLLKEKRRPNLAELDSICMQKIIWLTRADLHSAVVNSAAIRWANETLVKSGKFRETLPKDNNLITGDVFDYLSYQIIKQIPKQMKQDALVLAQKECIENGVSTIHALEGNEDTLEDVELVDYFFKTSPIHAVIYTQTEDATFPNSKNWQQMGGCLQVDGSIGSHTAALNEEYADDSSNKGHLIRNTEKIMKLLETAAVNRMQLAMHAIGDRALECVSACYALAAEKYGIPSRPHRIEHFILPTFDSISNAKKANAFICVQPTYDYYWGGANGMYAQRLGINRAAKCNPFKTLLESGLTLAAGSDSPATPINPLLGIHALVNHCNDEERLDLNTAISLFISTPHSLSGESGHRGFIRSGFAADFVCLNKDPFKVNPQKIKDISVTALYINGECVHKKISIFSGMRRFIVELLSKFTKIN